MGMNSKLHILLKTEEFKKLKDEAFRNQISLSDLCRLRLLQHQHFEKIEFMLENIRQKVEHSTKYAEEVKMVKKNTKTGKQKLDFDLEGVDFEEDQDSSEE